MNNLLLIKSGKAFRTLKRDGLFGMKRIITALWLTFKPIGKGDCLIISGGTGDSARYRGFHLAEELTLNGITTKVAFQDNPFLRKKISNFKVFIFHRVLYTGEIKKIITKIKQQNKKFLFEADDLVFDKKHLKYMDYFKKMNRFEKKLYENGVGMEILTDPDLTACTTTTEYLAHKLSKFNKNIHILHNKLSQNDLVIVNKIFAKIRKNDKIVKLGYFSGTASHDKDFSTIVEPLIYILKKFPNVKLFVAGPLNLDPRLLKFKKQIIKSQFVSRNKHFKNLSKVDINLIPLEIGNPFCESKSELKFFEAGILQIPSIASFTSSYNFIENGITGYKAINKKEWTKYLENLIVNKQLRINIGKNAHKLVNYKYINRKTKNTSFFDLLKSYVILQKN